MAIKNSFNASITSSSAALGGTDAARRRILLSGLGAASLAVPGLSFGQAKPIPIGLVVGLTGKAGAWGVPVSDAVRLAMDQINASGGVKSKGGAHLELIVADHQSNPQMAGTQTERVIQVDNVLAVIGNVTSGATMVGSAVAEKYKTPMLSTDLADALTTRGMKYFFRLGPRISLLGGLTVEYAQAMAKSSGVAPKRVATIADDSTFSQDAINGVLSKLKGGPWPLQENVSFPAGQVSDFIPILQRLKLSGVDMLFMATFPADGIAIQHALKTLNFDLVGEIHVAGAPFSPDFASALKQDSNFISDAVGFVSELTSKNALLAKFGDSYKAKYGKELDDQTSLAVTVVGTLYDALERSTDLTRESLWQALRTTDLKQGSNPYVLRDGAKFDENGDNQRTRGLIMQLRDQQQRIVYPADVATQKAVWPMPKWADRKQA
jgi:branched-chain amino acid transport system substrate-binding protein